MQSHRQYPGYVEECWRLQMMFRLFLGLSKGKKQTVNDLALKILIQQLSALQIEHKRHRSVARFQLRYRPYGY